MPPMRSFTVTEEREIKVYASTPTEAVMIAAEAFAKGESSVRTEVGHTTSVIKTTSIQSREEY